MAEQSKEELLREEYHKQTARIRWHDLQTYYAGGSVVRVDDALDLVGVAVQLGLDNASQFEEWISGGSIAPVTEDEALAWFEGDEMLWAVVAAPWVLVQGNKPTDS